MMAILETDRRPEAMADVPGVCELLLTRAIVQYRDIHELDLAGGRLQDVGLALVLEGRYASSAEVVDLGSATVKLLDLSAELVVLDWVYEPTLEHVGTLVRRAAATAVPLPDRESGSAGQEELGRFCFRMALRVLERVGYGPLTRPTLLRIGFRDVCHDLDLHESTSVRIVAAAGQVLRAHLDYDANALVFRTGGERADVAVEDALLEAFPHADVRRLVPAAGGSGGYHVGFPLPLTLAEARTGLSGMRRGLLHLLARFEPERYRTVERLTETFGTRDTLAALHVPEPRVRYASVRGRTLQTGPVVH